MTIDATPLHVLMVATSYPRTVSDWHGVFIRHLVAALARRDDLRMSLWAPPGERPPRVEYAATPAESAWLAKLAAAGGISHLMRNPRPATLLAPLNLLRYLRACYRRTSSADIYHVNWLQAALSLPDNRIPALITVLGNDMKLLGLPFMRSLMRRVMKRRAVAICPNAEWMVPQLTRAFGDLATIRPVSFGIDPIWFAMRREPSIDRPAWLAVMRITRAKVGPLFEWSERLFRDQARELHLFGPMQDKIEIPDWVHYHGPASPADLADRWFPRACGLVTLSQHAEGRPQVMLEAMAAALPIIASPLAAHTWARATPSHRRVMQLRGGVRHCSTASGKSGTEPSIWRECARLDQERCRHMGRLR